jgi:hypothetical protein
MTKTFNVQDYGAKGDGGLANYAFRKAFEDAQANLAYCQSEVVVPAGDYVLTKFPKIKSGRLKLVGSEHPRSLLWWPTNTGGRFIEIEGVRPPTDCVVIDGITVGSPNRTHKKTAIYAVDTSGLEIKNCGIVEDWTGGATGSVGIQLNGREWTTIKNWRTCVVDRPIVVGKNPNSTIDCDTLKIEDTYMRAGPTFAHITLDPRINVKSLRVLGHHAWGGGRWGVYWKAGATNETKSFRVVLNGIHLENEPVGAQHMIHLEATKARGLHHLSIGDCSNTGKNGAGGIFIDNMTGCVGIRDLELLNGLNRTTKERVEALNVGPNVREIQWDVANWAQLSVARGLESMSCVRQGHTWPYTPLPSSGHYVRLPGMGDVG